MSTRQKNTNSPTGRYVPGNHPFNSRTLVHERLEKLLFKASGVAPAVLDHLQKTLDTELLSLAAKADEEKRKLDIRYAEKAREVAARVVDLTALFKAAKEVQRLREMATEALDELPPYAEGGVQ